MAQAHRLVLSSPPVDAAPVSVRELQRSGFVTLDAAVCGNVAARGVFHLLGPGDVTRAALQHLARRLRAQGRAVFYGERSAARPAIADLLERAGLPSARDVKGALRVLAQHEHAVFLLADLERDSWDASVLADLQADLLVVSGAHALPATTFELEGTLDADGRALWLSGMCAELEARAPHELSSLDSWLARSVHLATADERPHDCAREAIAVLAAAGRPLTHELVQAHLGEHLAAECLAHGVNYSAGGLSFQQAEPRTASVSSKAAELLERAFTEDAWALARASILRLEAGDIDAATRALEAALEAAADQPARRDVFAMLAGHLQTAEPPADSFLLRASELALQNAEGAHALAWLRRVQDHGAQHALLQGRAHFATGDLVAANVALDRARNLDSHHALASAVAIELAELACARGDYARARDEAERVGTNDADLHLRARNVFGKILLAQSEWENADRHFAEDALVAGNAKLVTAEMRADLNRGIALLSRGRIDDADRQFARVLEQAEARDDILAILYALPNLAVAAMRKHDYGRALGLWERAARALHSTQNRLPQVRALVFANLAEMRIRLGLLEQASHVLAFSRRGAGAADVRSASTWLDGTEAALALRRGDTGMARRLATQALVEANRIGERHSAHLALCTLARTALEDGDVQTAAHVLEVECEAEGAGGTSLGRAEVMVLRAQLARAQGREDSLEIAEAALAPLRDADDEELLIEGLTLVALGYRDRGQEGLARQAAMRAVAVRDRVAETLPTEARASYLAKRENTLLHRLLGTLSPTPEPCPPSQVGRAETRGEARTIIGEAPQVSALRASIRKVARSNATVLVRGESGTGKELVAAALHAQSERASGPLVTVNCAALVETLLLSELFGHEKGAFTGAAARRRGRFEMAEGGTLFLDEIGDISPRTQVALLRVLQERTFERVGGTAPIHANVRVVCATHRNLAAMVERGEFREDLYYRLCGVVLEVPALRTRISDLPELARHLLSRIALERGDVEPTLSRDALELMARHRWPGNVRELENVLRSLSLFCENNVITGADLVTHHEAFAELASQRHALGPATLRTLPDPEPSGAIETYDADAARHGIDDDAPLSFIAPTAELTGDANPATEAAYAHVRSGNTSLFDLKRQIERDCILLALKETGGNITRAATLLGMKRPRLSQLVKQYQLSSEES